MFGPITNSENNVSETQNVELVEVLFAKSAEEAETVRALLENNSIYARLESSPNIPAQCGVAVLISPARLVEASEILCFSAPDNDDDDDNDHDDHHDNADADDDDDDDDDDDGSGDYSDDDDLDSDDEDLDDDEDDFKDGDGF